MWRRRRAIRSAAAAAGLGRVLRIHRERRAGGVETALWTIGVVSVAPAGIAATVMASEQSATRQFPLFGSFLVLLAVFGWTHFGPVHGGRHWIAVAERGLVVWSGSGVETTAWHGVEPRDVTAMSSPIDLAATIDLRAPVAVWTRGRFVDLCLACLVVLGGIGFTGVPVLRYALGAQVPTELDHLARICDGGPAFDVPEYTGRGPHPVAVFEGESREYALNDRRPEAVQLVGCARRIVEPRVDTVRKCEYSGGHVRELREARYRVDVYTARGGDRVTSVVVRGDSPRDCAEMIFPESDDEPGSRPEYRTPSSERYRARLAALIDNPARTTIG
ncbi:hypothetical protein FHS23_001491 [Prauserella isguenensis]|uniref:Uncharacterized protein n=1 Tax=Prauserella isguenensis TaxID=1470180 RepID=A0A839RYF8_9PSEU|nr:hypothetical protein [Prauserella isguenensis]MBB3050496.1 hypothetical protein [Prauserella isguenensis]